MRKKFDFLEKALFIIIGSALVSAGSLIAIGTPGTVFNTVASNLLNGSTLEDSMRAATTVETDRQLAQSYLEEIEAKNVELVITDSELNCALWETNILGVAKRKVSEYDSTKLSQGGCWRSDSPNTIYISSEITNPASLKFVVTHEYAHVLQGRGEWPSSVDGAETHMSSECLADIYAHKHGTGESNLFYLHAEECEDFKDLVNEEWNFFTHLSDMGY